LNGDEGATQDAENRVRTAQGQERKDDGDPKDGEGERQGELVALVAHQGKTMGWGET